MLSNISVINQTTAMTNIESLNRIFRFQTKAQTDAQTDIGSRRWPRLYTRLLSTLLVGFFGLASWLTMPAVSLADGMGIVPPEISISTSISALTADADRAVATEKVDQFAQAYLQVLELLSDRPPEDSEVESSAEALNAQQSIPAKTLEAKTQEPEDLEAEAIELIESSGLTMSEYIEMLSLASEDEAFRDQVLSRMNESLQK